ncbi:hypothetical protein RJT34_00386 [Clitoria ternatea]|uniref:Uncharacterized protein n=1 Tax=Clitoria ternatea TaxID=43366 RepID=A0AAN9KID0_CLITE
MQNPVYSSTKLDTIGNKKVKLDDNDASSAHEKKLGLKILSEEKKEKVKNCDSVGKQQKAVSPIRGILKNLRHISVSTSSDSNIQDGTEESRSDVQVPSSDSHVRFSAQDSILTPKNSNSLDETVFNSSSESQRSTGSHEGTVNLVENRNDEIAINTDNRKGVCNVVQSKQLSNALGPVSVQNFLKPCTIQEKSKHLAGNSESLSKVAFCDLHQFDKGNTYADFCRPLPAFQAGQTSVINTQACESEAFMYTGKSIDHFGDPAFQSATVHSNASTRTYLEPSPSYSATSMEEKERPGFPFHAYGDNDNNGQALGGRSWAGSGMFSVEKMDTFHLPGCGKGNIRNNCKEQNFFGLPLNSHGELINFSSSGNVGMNQPNVSSTLRGSLSGLSVNNVLHQNSQENLSVGKRHVFQKTLQDRVNPLPYYTGRFGVTELQGKERTDIYQQNSDRCSNHYVQLFDSELNRMRDPFIEQNPPDKVPNHKEYGMVSPRGNPGLVSASSSQPTMRLMGKDVPIGISSKEKQQFVGGVLWTDEESKKQYSVDAAKDNAFLGRGSMQDWVSGSILQVQTENVLQPVKILSNQALQSTFLVKGQKSEFHNLQNALISQNGSLGVSRNATSNLHPVTQASTSCEIYNMEPHYLSEQYISGAKPQGLCFQSTLTNAELNDRKKHQHFTNSAFSFPFLHPVVEEQAKTSWCKSSYGSLPPGSLGSTYERLPGSSCSVSSPQTAWGNKFTIPSMNHSADVLSPPNAVIPHCPRKSHLCPASIAQPPHVSITTVTKPPSAMNSGFKNIIKVTDGVKLEDMTAIDYHAHTNSRKRPAANNLVDRAKPNKLPNIEVQRNSSHIAGLGRETSNSYLQRNTRAVELDLQVGARSKSCQNEAQKVKPRSYTGFDSFGLDGMVISGPVKLTPGAKHILEPPQNMDQDNPRPIHSAIPIAATTDFGRDLELQSKLKKMYRF